MLGLTLNPEWAWAICHAGKRIENRTWKPHPDALGQDIAIHAGAKVGGKASAAGYRLAVEALEQTMVENGTLAAERPRGEAAPFLEFGRQKRRAKRVFRANLPPATADANTIERVVFDPRQVKRSAIVAVARLKGAVRFREGDAGGECHGPVELEHGRWSLARERGARPPWSIPDHWWWVLEDVRVLSSPVPCSGRLGLWPLAHDIRTTLETRGRVPAWEP